MSLSIDFLSRGLRGLCLLLPTLIASGCQESPHPAPRGVQRLFTQAGWKTVGPTWQRQLAFRKTIPSRVSEAVTVPRGGVFSWQYAARHPGLRQTVEVSVSVRDDAGEHTLYEESVETASQEPVRWISGRVDLGDWAGESVDIVLEARSTRRRGKASYVYWGSPYLLGDPGASGRPPSVVLVLIDTLRADRLGAYGYSRDLTPHLDDLATRGTLFENAVSQSNWTLPSTASLVSGLYPSTHGVVQTRDRLRRDPARLPRLMARNGYATHGFHDGGFLQRQFGFDDGFDRYTKWSGFADMPKAMQFVEEHRDVPFFLFLHTYDVHAPYASVPEPYWSRYVRRDYVDPHDLRDQRPAAAPRSLGRPLTDEEFEYYSDLYDGEVRFVDDRLGELIEQLERLDLTDRTLLMVVSDHGEEFNDHGGAEHRTSNLHAELVRVPLIMAGPGIPPGVRVAETVQLVDVLPTLADLLDLEGLDRASIDGLSYADLLRSTDSPTGGSGRLGWSQFKARWSLRSGHWALLGDTEGELSLYDRSLDPGEHHDVAVENAEVVVGLQRQLRILRSDSRRKEGQAAEAELDDALIDSLRALGYIE